MSSELEACVVLKTDDKFYASIKVGPDNQGLFHYYESAGFKNEEDALNMMHEMVQLAGTVFEFEAGEN
jgi:hypothetical protein